MLIYFYNICFRFFSRSFSIFCFYFTKGSFVIGGNIVTIENLRAHCQISGSFIGVCRLSRNIFKNQIKIVDAQFLDW